MHLFLPAFQGAREIFADAVREAGCLKFCFRTCHESQLAGLVVATSSLRKYDIPSCKLISHKDFELLVWRTGQGREEDFSLCPTRLPEVR